MTGTWGSGQGRQDIDRRDGKWRPKGVDAFPGGQAVQDRKRGGEYGANSGAAQPKGDGWVRSWYTEGDGDNPENS